MNEISKKSRGRPFAPGNPGRPPGSKNKTTRMLEQMLEGQAEKFVETLKELALAGDVTCLRIIIDRLMPARKGSPISIEVPELKTSEDVIPAVAAVWNAIREGRITPEEAASLCLLMDRSIKAIETQDMLKRLDALEQRAKLGSTVS